MGVIPRPCGSEGDPGDERRDEAVAAQCAGGREAADRGGQGGQSTASGQDPAPPRSERDQLGAGESDGDADADADGSVRAAGGVRRCVVSCTPSSSAATASVKTTIGVTMPSLSPLSTLRVRRTRVGIRSSLITCALSAASVGARAAPTKPASAHVKSWNIHAATSEPSHHRERKADPEQSRRKAGVVTEAGQVHSRRVREEQQRQRHLGEQVDRRGFNIDGERSPAAVRKNEAEHREHEGAGDVPSSEAIRDDRPPEHQHHEYGEGEFRHYAELPSLGRSSPGTDGASPGRADRVASSARRRLSISCSRRSRADRASSEHAGPAQAHDREWSMRSAHREEPNADALDRCLVGRVQLCHAGPRPHPHHLVPVADIGQVAEDAPCSTVGVLRIADPPRGLIEAGTSRLTTVGCPLIDAADGCCSMPSPGRSDGCQAHCDR